MTSYAPIVIFCYRRTISDLLDSLLKNKESCNSNLYIFSDGYKNESDKNDVLTVRDEISQINSGFKTLKIIESEKNKGLAKSIIDGVDLVIKEYGRVIVLEDDLVVSKFFLQYMNEALEFHANNEKIWSISGYSPPLNCLQDYPSDTFLSLRSSSWGWATWRDRWQKIDWDVKSFNQLKGDKNKITAFNKGGNDLFKMLELQMLGKIDSWAIRWCYAQFENNAYSLTPKQSTVQNLGFLDGVGTHNTSHTSRWKASLAKVPVTIQHVKPNQKLLDCFEQYHKLSPYTRIGYFLKKHGGYAFLKKIIQIIQIIRS